MHKVFKRAPPEHEGLLSPSQKAALRRRVYAYIVKHGQRRPSEIADSLNLPINDVLDAVDDLLSSGCISRSSR